MLDAGYALYRRTTDAVRIKDHIQAQSKLQEEYKKVNEELEAEKKRTEDATVGCTGGGVMVVVIVVVVVVVVVVGCSVVIVAVMDVAVVVVAVVVVVVVVCVVIHLPIPSAPLPCVIIELM